MVLCFECAAGILLRRSTGDYQDRRLCTGHRLGRRAFSEFMESWAMSRGEGSSWMARGKVWWVRRVSVDDGGGEP